MSNPSGTSPVFLGFPTVLGGQGAVAGGAISYTSSNTSTSDVYGIFNFGSSNTIVSNNQIGNITNTNSSTGGATIYAIRNNTVSAATGTFANNVIGGALFPITSASSSTASIVMGIRADAALNSITGNNV